MSDWKSTALLLGAGVGAYIFIVKPQLDNFGKGLDAFGKATTQFIQLPGEVVKEIITMPGEVINKTIIEYRNLPQETKDAMVDISKDPLGTKQFFNDLLNLLNPNRQSKIQIPEKTYSQGNVFKTQEQVVKAYSDTGTKTIPGTLLPQQSSTIKLGAYDTGIPTVTNKSLPKDISTGMSVAPPKTNNIPGTLIPSSSSGGSSSSSKSLNTSSAPKVSTTTTSVAQNIATKISQGYSPSNIPTSNPYKAGSPQAISYYKTWGV